jgi:hypothetical protein
MGSWGALDQALLAGSGFTVAVTVAQTDGPRALGIYTLMQSITLAIGGLIRAAFGDPLIIEARSQQRSDGLAVALPLLMGHILLGCLLCIVWQAFERHTRVPTVNGAGLMLLGLLPLASFQEVARSIRLAGMGAKGLLWGDLWVVVARLAALSLYFVGVRGYILGLSALASGGVASVFSVRRYLHGPHSHLHALRLWSLGRWLVSESLLFSITTYGIWAMVVPRAGAEIAGQLRAGQQLFAPMQTVLAGVNIIALGHLASPDSGSSPGRSAGTLRAGVVGLWGLIVICIGPSVMTSLFGEEFLLTRLELLALTSAMMATAFYEFLALALRARKNGRTLLIARAIGGIVTLLMTLMVGHFVVGVAMAMLIGQAAAAVVSTAHLRPRQHRSLRR